MHKTTLPMVLCLLIAGAGTAIPQVSARQGVAPPSEIVKFDSPMVLDLPFPNVATIGSNSQVKLPSVWHYICDQHVKLQSLTVGKQYKGPRKARSLELVISGWVSVADSYDRRVDIALSLRNGDAVLATQVLRNHKAEEETSSPFRIVLPVDEPTLLAAYEAEPGPVLELTLTVRDDS